MILWLGLATLSVALAPAATPQNDAQIRPKSDYMGSILSRNTKTIGLLQDRTLQRMMSQTGRKWAVRSSARHILD
ncbi:MAG: hypothetical protein NTZ26_00710 [Candidatus Aminicenantes bacterium]|nr:hypothetical protein [Candidatus Aminicenantes bacterium]